MSGKRSYKGVKSEAVRQVVDRGHSQSSGGSVPIWGPVAPDCRSVMPLAEKNWVRNSRRRGKDQGKRKRFDLPLICAAVLCVLIVPVRRMLENTRSKTPQESTTNA